MLRGNPAWATIMIITTEFPLTQMLGKLCTIRRPASTYGYPLINIHRAGSNYKFSDGFSHSVEWSLRSHGGPRIASLFQHIIPRRGPGSMMIPRRPDPLNHPVLLCPPVRSLRAALCDERRGCMEAPYLHTHVPTRTCDLSILNRWPSISLLRGSRCSCKMRLLQTPGTQSDRCRSCCFFLHRAATKKLATAPGPG